MKKQGPKQPTLKTRSSRSKAAPTEAPVVKLLGPFPKHPSITHEVWNRVLDLLRAGRGLLRICRENPSWPDRITFLRAVSDASDEQRNIYARACEDGADAMVDEAMDIADDGSNDTYLDDNGFPKVNSDVIQRSRLRVEQRRWHASKLKSKKYGEKIEVATTVVPTPQQALERIAQLAAEELRLIAGGK